MDNQAPTHKRTYTTCFPGGQWGQWGVLMDQGEGPVLLRPCQIASLCDPYLEVLTPTSDPIPAVTPTPTLVLEQTQTQMFSAPASLWRRLNMETPHWRPSTAILMGTKIPYSVVEQARLVLTEVSDLQPKQD